MRVLAWAAVVAVFVLMTVGNIVSATGSGLACPDWPLCRGHLIPPFEPDVLIEYGHRLTAGATSLLLVGTLIATIRSRESPGARRVGIGLLVLLCVQIALGGVTVLLRLPNLISTLHLVTALLILAGLLVLASRSAPRPNHREVPDKIRRLARSGLLVLLAQLALGGYVRHAGAGLACPDFPLCSGNVFPGHWLGVVHWVHRWLGVALLGFFVHVAIAARGTRVAGAAGVVAALAVLQVALGITTVLLRLDPAIRTTHATVGYLLWASLVWLSLRVGCWDRALADEAGPHADRVEVAHAS